MQKMDYTVFGRSLLYASAGLCRLDGGKMVRNFDRNQLMLFPRVMHLLSGTGNAKSAFLWWPGKSFLRPSAASNDGLLAQLWRYLGGGVNVKATKRCKSQMRANDHQSEKRKRAKTPFLIATLITGWGKKVGAIWSSKGRSPC